MSITVIETALPLPAKAMVEFFKDKQGVAFLVDYEASLANLRSVQAILNYIANLQLRVEFTFTEIPIEVLHTYSIMRDKVRCEQLTRAHANALYFYKYGFELYDQPEFDNEAKMQYLKEYTDDVTFQLALLNSIPLFVATSIVEDEETVRSEHESVKIIYEEQHRAISVNLCQLFSYDHFLIMFLESTIDLDHQVYFTRHYDDHMYAGQTMFGLFAVPDNSYFSLYQHVADSIQGDDEERKELIAEFSEVLNSVEGA